MPSPFYHVVSTLYSHQSIEMEEAEKLTWDFPHLAKLGAYYAIAPYQFLQTAANAQTAFLQHFSEVSQGCQQKNLFSMCVCSIYTHIMYSGIFSQVWNSNIRSDDHHTSLQCKSCTRHEMLLGVSCSAAITLQFHHTLHMQLKVGSQWVSGTVDTDHEQGHSMSH